MSQPASESENDIHVEIDVPAAEPETPEPETPAVVVVETPAPDATPDGLLPVLMELQERLGRLEAAVIQTAEVAVEAAADAGQALSNDSMIADQVAEIAADVEEALEEDQAPADQDESPRKAHWLHR
jgi:hypothetical protein